MKAPFILKMLREKKEPLLSVNCRCNIPSKVLPLPVSYCKIYDIDSFFIDDGQGNRLKNLPDFVNGF